MNQQAYEIIIGAMESLLKEKNFQRKEDEAAPPYYSDGTKAIRVIYDETKQLFLLQLATLEEGEEVAFATLSTWLFDQNGTQQDATSIGNDFTDTLKGAFGVRESRVQQDVALPGRGEPGKEPGVEAFTNRFLAMFPQYKDAYRENVAANGEFLYDAFYSRYGVEAVRSMMQSGNKKQQDRMFGLLDEMYCKGDRALISCVVYSILAKVLIEEPDFAEAAAPYLEHRPFLSASLKSVKECVKSPAARKKYLL